MKDKNAPMFHKEFIDVMGKREEIFQANISVRLYVATQILSGALGYGGMPTDKVTVNKISLLSLKLADALIEASNKEQGNE